MKTKYRFRFFFDYGSCSPLWSDSDATERHFGYSVDPLQLPIKEQTRTKITSLCAWFCRSLNWDRPSDPCPWRQDECERFNQEAEMLFDSLKKELGSDFEIIDEFDRFSEDPDLKKFLK